MRVISAGDMEMQGASRYTVIVAAANVPVNCWKELNH